MKILNCFTGDVTFRALSDQWWDPNGPLSGLHSMNSLRVPFVRDGLLQIGAATGPLAEPLSGLVRRLILILAYCNCVVCPQQSLKFTLNHLT